MEDLTKVFSELKKYRVISIIGLSKNVSKTTTLNHIIKFSKGKLILGITSIGRDGEEYDAITRLPKPRIMVEPGTLIATASQSLKNSKINPELLKKTGIYTPMGEVQIVRSLNRDLVEIAGPSTNSEVKKVCKQLLELGCDLVLIDGAFDRRSFATPHISDATILSTGASVSRNMESVVDLTSHICDIFKIDIVSDTKIWQISQDLLKIAQIGIINDDLSVIQLEERTALGSSKVIFNQITSKARYLVIKGAITDNILNDYLINKKVKNTTIIATDPTKLFVSRNTYYKFIKKGGQLKVLYPITLIAITVNPTSPLGYQFNINQFIKLLQKKISLPIFNLGPCDNL